VTSFSRLEALAIMFLANLKKEVKLAGVSVLSLLVVIMHMSEAFAESACRSSNMRRWSPTHEEFPAF
jgi:hypothetical protein